MLKTEVDLDEQVELNNQFGQMISLVGKLASKLADYDQKRYDEAVKCWEAHGKKYIGRNVGA